MAKKPNEPFKKYIPVLNNRDLYVLCSLLSNKNNFKVLPESAEAIANTNTDTNISVTITGKITEYNIEQNPSLLLQTSKQEVITKLLERLNNLDSLAQDVYLALFAHWLDYKDDSGDAYIDIDDIHFKYRGLGGTNKTSTIRDEDYINYRKAIDVLRNTSLKVNINKNTNIVYDKIKNLKFGAIEGFLVQVTHITYYDEDSDKIRGFKYNLSVIQDTFTISEPIINYLYPTSLLQLTTKSETVKNLGNYLCYLHKQNELKGNKISAISLYVLMGESNYAIKGSRYQEGINRFLINLKKIEQLLQKESIITHMDIPEDVDSKNYKFKKVDIHWNYSNIILVNA